MSAEQRRRRPASGSGEDEAEDESEEDEKAELDTADDDIQLPSIIPEPGQATPLQRKWIQAMSEGKSEEIANRFRQYVLFGFVNKF